jgi:hypothetical protein
MFKFLYKILLLLVLLSATSLLYQKNTYAYHTLTQIDPLPKVKTLINQHKYAQAHSYLSYFMQFEYMKQNNEAETILRHIQAIRSSIEYQSQKIAEGIRTGKSDELSGQVSAIGSDFFLIGDIRDLALEGTHYFQNEKVDKVLVSLSTLGLVASISTFLTFGSTALAKSGISMLKLAHKNQSIPLWLGSFLVKQSQKIKHTKDLSTLTPIFKHLLAMRQKIGMNATLNLLSQSKSFHSFLSISRLSQRYGKESSILMALSKNQIIREHKILQKHHITTIKLASTYGVGGFTHLIKGGDKHFIKTTQNMKAYAKIGYKGTIWEFILLLMKYFSNTTLLLAIGISTLLLLPSPKKI